MSYQKLDDHFGPGHEIAIVDYGNGAQMAVECETCKEVLLSRDRPNVRFPILNGAFDPACEGCGACCTVPASTPEPRVNVCIFSDEELKRWPPEVQALVVATPQGALGFPARRDGSFDACIFLEGKVGTDAGCTLHSTKPTECRWFLPGSSGCLTSRRQRGLPKHLDPNLRRDARDGNVGATLLEMRTHLGEIPNSIARPGEAPDDHYGRELARKGGVAAKEAE